MNQGDRDLQQAPSARRRDAGWFATLRAVLWGFFGVRGAAQGEQDAARLNPVHVIIAGIVAAALFVITLIVIVRFVAG